MGQKVHPVGFRLGITRTWDSRWFEDKQYRQWLHEDLAMRKQIDSLSRSAAVSKVEIERRANQARVIISTGKPGIIIGKRGAGIEDLRKKLEKIAGRSVNVNVVEIKHPELDAKLVANNVVDQLEKRIAFRRAMRQALQRTIKAGAKGIKVQCGGRLGGSEIARVERNFEGKVPLHTLRANIDFAHSEAYTTFGRIGVKVWIYLGEVLPDGRQKAEPRELRPVRRNRPRPIRPGETPPAVAAPAAAGAAPAATAAAASASPSAPVVPDATATTSPSPATAVAPPAPAPPTEPVSTESDAEAQSPPVSPEAPVSPPESPEAKTAGPASAGTAPAAVQTQTDVAQSTDAEPAASEATPPAADAAKASEEE
ncbi:MAG: 30S ribosomal protein S3 [Candidatus Eremiobacteraeota bacterium]|nr:30S ribosomal protein S3 [Candidatus Eremiobacteraeota bacterium]